jgi:hypothetical protein
MWPEKPVIRRLLTVAVACAGLSVMLPAPASAVLITKVTSPANQSTFFFDQSDSNSNTVAFTATGTSNAASSDDLDCASGNGSSVLSLVTDSPVPAGSFSIPVTYAELATAAHDDNDGPCMLSLVPTGATPPHPGASNALDTGPLISISDVSVQSKSGVPFDFYGSYTGVASGAAGSLEFASPADCGLEDSWVTYGTSTLSDTNDAFDCLGGLYNAYTSIQDAAVKAPADLTVDGTSAAVADSFNGPTTLSGYEQPTFTDSFTGGELTINDDEPLMLCASTCDGSAPSSGYKPSGVELERTWQTADNGLVALQTDVFKSTNGAAHALTVDEDDEFEDDSATGASADFPGTSGFLSYQPGSTIAPVSGPGAIYFKTNLTTPDSGDPASQWLQGAIAYTRAPSSPITVTYWTASGDWSPEFYLPYTLQVPAGGTVAVRFAYVQDIALSDVRTMAQQALTGFDPSLTLTSPSNNSTSASPEVTVSGAAGDAAGIKSVTVNGEQALVGGDGTFSDTVDLPIGANAVSVVATDADGLASAQTAAVTVAMQVTTGLGTKIKVIGKLKAGKPHHYKLNGALKLPAGVSAAQGCSGKITVTARKGRRKVASATATVSPTCSWSAKFTVKHLKRRGKLSVAVAFGGNASIKPFTPKALKTKY